jgi:hypothetical protein
MARRKKQTCNVKGTVSQNGLVDMSPWGRANFVLLQLEFANLLGEKIIS